MFLDIDFDGIRTRNLLIWSPTRYRCHTMSCKEASRTVQISGFLSFRYSFFLSYKYVYLSLNWHSFTWNQKNPDQVNKPFP